jgi:cbb3-type cytochrome oxidase maturation protein
VDSLYLLIPIALVFCAITIWLLLWAIGSGQYDDLDKEAWRILSDDEPIAKTPRINPQDAGQAAGDEP